MTETLFGASPTITFPDNAEDTYSMATRVTFAVAGQVIGARIWGTTNAVTSSPSAAIYTTGGVQQVAKALGSYTTSAWNTVTFNTPFAVAAGSTYDIVFGPINRYAGNTSVFPLTVGNLTGVKGRFVSSAVLTFPTNDSGGSGSTWYGIDVLFDLTGTTHSADGTTSETFARPGVVSIDRPIAGNRTSTFALPGTLGHTAAGGGSADLGLTIVGALSTSSTTTTTRSTGNGWWGFKNIMDEARSEAQFYATQPPTACPNDGEPLITASDGRLFCPFDGWPNV